MKERSIRSPIAYGLYRLVSPLIASACQKLMGQAHHSQLSPDWESWFGALSGTNRDSPDHIPNAMERQRFSTLSAIMNRNFKRPFSMTGAISQDRKRCQFLFLLDEKPLAKNLLLYRRLPPCRPERQSPGLFRLCSVGRKGRRKKQHRTTQNLKELLLLVFSLHAPFPFLKNVDSRSSRHRANRPMASKFVLVNLVK